MVKCMTKLRGNPWAVLVVVSLGFFMTLLDLTIVNIAIPNMIDKLNASLDDVLWVLNAYALVLAVLLITAGRLGDRRLRAGGWWRHDPYLVAESRTTMAATVATAPTVPASSRGSTDLGSGSPRRSAR